MREQLKWIASRFIAIVSHGSLEKKASLIEHRHALSSEDIDKSESSLQTLELRDCLFFQMKKRRE